MGDAPFPLSGSSGSDHSSVSGLVYPFTGDPINERLTNYGSVNRSQLLTCLHSSHRLTKLSPFGSIPASRRRGRGCEPGLSVLKCSQTDHADGELHYQSLSVGMISAAP